MFISQANAQELGKITPSVELTSADIISNLVNIALAVGGLLFFFMLLYGGFKYLMAGGDEKAAASARGALTHAFIGLVIIVASFLIAQLIFGLFDLEGLLFFRNEGITGPRLERP